MCSSKKQYFVYVYMSYDIFMNSLVIKWYINMLCNGVIYISLCKHASET